MLWTTHDMWKLRLLFSQDPTKEGSYCIIHTYYVDLIVCTFLRDPTSPKKDCMDLENVMQKCIREISKFANV